MEPLTPRFQLQIPIAMIEQKLEGLKAKLGADDADLVAKLAASLAIRKVAIPDAHCRVGRQFRVAAPRAKKRARRKAAPLAVAAETRVPAPVSCPLPSDNSVRATNSEAGIAAVLSPSQVRTWFDCQARWYFGKVVGLPEPKNSNLALGIALHDALAHNFRQKIETAKDLPAAEVIAAFDIAWQAVQAETELREDENADEIAAAGRALIEKFMVEVAPDIHPAAVEQELSGEIAGVKVTGRVDVLDVEGRIHDFKSSGRTPNDVEPDQLFQLATYAELAGGRGATGEVRIHSLVKTKTPKLVQLTRTIDEQDRAAIEKQYPLAQEGMRTGLYMPNRTSMLCSRRNCAFWRECQTEFGGKVPLT